MAVRRSTASRPGPRRSCCFSPSSRWSCRRVVALVSYGSLEAHPKVIDHLSFWSSIVLLGVYGAGLIFAFRSHRDPLRGDPGEEHGTPLGVAPAIALLAFATIITAVEAEVLIQALEPALSGLGMSELFAGVIVVALVGNAAEHYSAVTAARDNEMALALEISVGSSAQIALMVAPALVLLSYALGSPMSLVFNAFEITAIGLSVFAVALVVARRRDQLARRPAAARCVRHPRHCVLPHS